MDAGLYDVIIIGGGPGGYSAALYCARSGLSTLVLERLSPGGQMAATGQVDNYPGFADGIDGFALAEQMQAGAERFGAQTQFSEVRAVRLQQNPKELDTSDGLLRAKTVILATGAYPRELGLPEENTLRGRGVTYCATCDGRLYQDKTVVVTGGGNSAAEDALFLAKLCKKVYLVHRRDALRASAVYQKALAHSPVEMLLERRIESILHDKKVTGVRLANLRTGEAEELTCDGVFIAIGRVPDTKLFAGQIDLDENGYILADETTKTSVPGVFAVGDARTKPLRQIVTAAADGAVASKFAEEFLTEQM